MRKKGKWSGCGGDAHHKNKRGHARSILRYSQALSSLLPLLYSPSSPSPPLTTGRSSVEAMADPRTPHQSRQDG